MESWNDNEFLKIIFWEFQRGNKKEALIYLERLYPELKGISND